MSQSNPVSADAPLHIGTVSLVVRDLERVAAFYEDVLGLSEIGRDGEHLHLGAGGRTFLELIREPGAALASPRASGLFHTAFLLPTRADLGRWVRHAAQTRMPLQGASDHGVSEAIYLADPEGNGVEIYADRPVAEWPREGAGIAMVTEALDVEDLIQAGGEAPYTGAPAGTYVGHVHLQVGSVDAADGFYRGILGFDLAQRMPSASFLSTGGYHHHVAANVWNSRGAPPRGAGTTGLKSFELLAKDNAVFERTEASILAASVTAARQGEAIYLQDPAGVGVVLRRS